LSREKITLLQSVRAEVLDLASKLNAALATLTDVLRSKSSKHRDASGGTTLQLAQDLLSGLEDGDETSDSSKAVAQRADATMTSPTRTEKYWPGNDPLYGDPGISSIPGKVAREFRKELPHSFAWLSPDELRDARKARFMARYDGIPRRLRYTCSEIVWFGAGRRWQAPAYSFHEIDSVSTRQPTRRPLFGKKLFVKRSNTLGKGGRGRGFCDTSSRVWRV
jgi:hypothetical protein